jgi:hypothetical protein
VAAAWRPLRALSRGRPLSSRPRAAPSRPAVLPALRAAGQLRGRGAAELGAAGPGDGAVRRRRAGQQPRTSLRRAWLEALALFARGKPAIAHAHAGRCAQCSAACPVATSVELREPARPVWVSCLVMLRPPRYAASLHRLFRAHDPRLTAKQRFAVAWQVAEGLRWLHLHRVIHRDLKVRRKAGGGGDAVAGGQPGVRQLGDCLVPPRETGPRPARSPTTCSSTRGWMSSLQISDCRKCGGVLQRTQAGAQT